MSLLLGGGTITSPARAQAPAQEDRKQAAEHYREGQLLFEAELYGAAIKSFERAHALFPAPANLYNIAKCHERLAQSGPCVEAYEVYLKAYRAAKGEAPPDVNDIENAMAKCRIGMRVTLKLNSNPPGAAVALGTEDKLVGQTPMEVPLEPGTHTLFLTLDGYQPLRRTVEVIAGRPFQLDLELSPALSLTVETNPPGATVAIDKPDRVAGQTPLKVEREPGRYRVFVTLADHTPVSVEVDLTSGKPVRLFFKLERARHMGHISLGANIRRAAIFVDGKNIGLTPYVDPIEVPVGAHQITLTRDGYTSVAAELVVEEGMTVDFHGDLWLRDPPTTWKGYLGWTGVALGALSGVGGYVMGTQVDGMLLYQGTPELTDWQTRQAALYGAGGGLAALGVFLAVMEMIDDQLVDPEDAAEAPREPTLRLGAAGLRGTF